MRLPDLLRKIIYLNFPDQGAEEEEKMAKKERETVVFSRTDGLKVVVGPHGDLTLRAPMEFRIEAGEARSIHLGITCESHAVLVHSPRGQRHRGVLLEGRKVFDAGEPLILLLKCDLTAGGVQFELGEKVVRVSPLPTDFNVVD